MQLHFAIAVFGAPVAFLLIYLGVAEADSLAVEDLVRFPLFIIGIGLYFYSIVHSLWITFQYKPIYDRWVTQHGTNPYNWPDANQPE